jgi:hypothetical protein
MRILLDCGSDERFDVVNWVLAVSIALNNCFIAMLNCVFEAAPQSCTNS